MLDTLRAWLNGNREYFSGVALLSRLSDNAALVALFRKGPTPYTSKRLPEELLEICNQLKAKNEGSTDSHSTMAGSIRGNDRPVNIVKSRLLRSARNDDSSQTPAKTEVVSEVNGTEEAPENLELYDACKLRADKQYKQTMNDRAHLFALAATDEYADANLPDKVAERAKLALQVVQGYQLASSLYEQADYVKKHGRLPDEEGDQPEGEYDALPDMLVKATLDNLRKNVGKLKKREQAPERVALIQKHEGSIKKLEARWGLLKPQG